MPNAATAAENTDENLFVTVVQPDERQLLLAKQDPTSGINQQDDDEDEEDADTVYYYIPSDNVASSDADDKVDPAPKLTILQSLQEDFVRLFPSGMGPAVRGTLAVLALFIRFAIYAAITLLFIALKLVFMFLNSSIFAAFLAILFTVAATGTLLAFVAVPIIQSYPATSHIEFLANNFIYPAYTAQAWSILSEQPSYCLSADHSNSVMKPEDFITGTQYVTARRSSATYSSLSQLTIRAGGQMRSNIVFKAVPSYNNNFATIEYSVAHNGSHPTHSSSFIQYKAVEPTGYYGEDHLFWLNAGSEERHQRRGWYHTRNVGCAYANITVTIPSRVSSMVKVFVAATKPNIVIEESAQDLIKSIRVIEPIQRKLSERTIEDR
ncbi:hypothetical protein GQ42DRAFT_163243 [Ramicandelaber brevisporus]|nr:hypothetical protein GQ42DRAFT_163243 [Ramicandelaber brevisporus]